MNRIVLTDENFKALVQGEIVETQTVSGDLMEICLQDIGFNRMLDHITDAIG
jgi:hypothetical protein